MNATVIGNTSATSSEGKDMEAQQDGNPISVDLTPMMTAQHAAQLKIMLGKFSMPVEDYSRVVPALITILDGVMKNEFILIRNPNAAPVGTPPVPHPTA